MFNLDFIFPKNFESFNFFERSHSTHLYSQKVSKTWLSSFSTMFPKNMNTVLVQNWLDDFRKIKSPLKFSLPYVFEPFVKAKFYKQNCVSEKNKPQSWLQLKSLFTRDLNPILNYLLAQLMQFKVSKLKKRKSK